MCRRRFRHLNIAPFLLLALFTPPQGVAQVTNRNSADASTAQTLRLTFRFDPDGVELVRLERLQKVAPGQVLPSPVEGKNSGAWLVLLDASDKPLFYRSLDDPFRLRAEHHSNSGQPSVHLRTVTTGEFQALLPVIPGAQSVALFSSPSDPQRMAEPARELARYRIDNRQN